MAFRKLVGSYKDYNLSTHILEDGYLAVDVYVLVMEARQVVYL